MSELELRKIELGRISSEFEAKMKKKEVSTSLQICHQKQHR